MVAGVHVLLIPFGSTEITKAVITVWAQQCAAPSCHSTQSVLHGMMWLCGIKKSALVSSSWCALSYGDRRPILVEGSFHSLLTALFSSNPASVPVYFLAVGALSCGEVGWMPLVANRILEKPLCVCVTLTYRISLQNWYQYVYTFLFYQLDGRQ